MPDILVTGGSGQLGSEIKTIHSQFSDFTFQFPGRSELDLAVNDSVRNFFNDRKFDLIINCGAYTKVDGAEEEPDLAFQINGEAPGVLAEQCKAKDTRLIHISTDYVFDGMGSRPLKEMDITNPINIYGQSKLMGEKNIQMVLDDVYILRSSWLYSSFGANFVKTMMKLGKEKEELPVVVDQIGTPTYANDLANLLLKIAGNIITRKNDQPGIYHFSNEGIASWYDFAIAIVELSKISCKINPILSEKFSAKARRPSYTVMDKSKIREYLSIEINHWRQSLAQSIH